MSVPNVVNSGAGLRRVQIYALDTNGLPTGTTAGYTGVQIEGAKVMGLTDPTPRKVEHSGDDRVEALDSLPAITGMTGTLTVSKTNRTVDAMVQGITAQTIGEAVAYPFNTDLKGSENQVMLMSYFQSQDTGDASATRGKRTWVAKIFPKAWVIPLENPTVELAHERTYDITPNIVTKYPWGVALTTAAEGALNMQGFEMVCEKKPQFAFFTTNGVTTSFTLPNAAYTTAKIKAYAITTAGVGTASTPTTTNTTSIAYSAAPTTGTLAVFYEVV
jgi:hypothetical protein